MKRTLGLLPHALVVASEAPSLFGGPAKLRIETLPTIARVVDGAFVLSDEPARADEIAIDVLRLLTAPHVDGNARTASAIARRAPPRPASRGVRAGSLPSVNDLLDAVSDAILVRGFGAPASGALAPGALAAGALASDALASGALASGALASGALASRAPARGANAPTAHGPLGMRFVRPRALLDSELGKGLCARLTSAGLVEDDLSSLLERGPSADRIVVDDLDVRRLDDEMPRLSGAGQAATLAAGLAPHVVAWMVESAGAAGLEVMKNGYDVFARRVAVLQAERRLLHGLREGVTPCRLGGAASDVFPPLSSSAVRLTPAIAAEVERLRASGGKNAKIEGLVAAFEQRALAMTTSWHALRAVEVEVRLPPLAPAAEWWARQEGITSLRGDVIVAGVNDELFAQLRKSGSVVPMSPSWFVGRSDGAEAGHTPAPVDLVGANERGRGVDDAAVRVATPTPAKTAVLAPTPGLADIEPPSLERNASASVVTSARPTARGARPYDAPFVDPAVLAVGPALGGSLRIVVDGNAIDDAEARFDVVARRGDERIVRLTSLPNGQPLAHGAVVCVERDPPELS